jgi:hypothetical protein
LFSQRDYQICLRDGVPEKKLMVLPHPLKTKTKEFIAKIYLNGAKGLIKEGKYIMLVLPDVKIGYVNSKGSLISAEKRVSDWLSIASAINKVFPSYVILVKPHPMAGDYQDMKKKFEGLNEKVKVIDIKEPADKYIQMAEIIVGMPLSASTVLFTASLQNPGKKILSLDFDRELLGDCFKDAEGIRYIDSMKQFMENLYSFKKNTILDGKTEELQDNKVADVLFELFGSKQ